MKMIENVLRGLCMLFFISTAAAQVVAPSARAMAIDIRAQAMADALNDWAQQTGMQLIVPDEEPTNQLRAPAVKGKLTPLAALEKLIAGSPLTYSFVNARTVAVRQGTRMATRPTLDMDDLKRAGLDMMFASLDEVIVLGSRLPMPKADPRTNPYIETPVPVTVFNREKIESLGASSVPDLLKFLPQQPSRRSEGTFRSGAQNVELRGLGFDTTLVMINGRRTLASAASLGSNIFDLNSIPVTAVERVEVLSDSASAIYGADAVGGVVNVVLKKDIEHPTLDLHYGVADGGADERRAAFSYGFSKGRLHTSLLLDYFDRNFLLGAERDRMNNQDFRRFGGADWRTGSANPGNVTSRSSANLPGLPSRTAAVPSGSTGVGLTPADFLATAGQRNLVSLGQYTSIYPETRRRGAAAFIDFDVNPQVKAFGELYFFNRHTMVQSDPVQLTNARVSAANPYNPWSSSGTDVSVDFLLSGVGPRQTVTKANLRQGVAGLRGEAGKWDWEVSLLRTDEDSSAVLRNEVNLSRVNAALLQSDPALALNPFQDGPGGNAELLASLRSEPHYAYRSAATQAAAALRGKLFSVPAGEIEAVIGGEWLKADMLFREAVFIERDREVAAGFAELRIPLVAADMNLPAVNALTLTLAARHDHYNDFGNTFNPQYGLVWKPLDSLMLRASYSTSFRAPSLFELYSPRQVNPGVLIPDALRNNLISPVTFITGGNENLEPTEAESFSAGFVFAPAAISGLQLSSSYWRIHMDQRVKILPFNIVITHADEFPGRIQRADPTPLDIAAGRPGALTSLDISRVNFGTVETDGVDSAVAYAVETPAGTFSSSVSATWVAHFSEIDIPGSPMVDRVDRANLQGTIPRWRVVGTLAWKKRSVGASVSARYLPSYSDANGLTGAPTGESLGAQTFVDLQGSIDFAKLWSERIPWASGLKLIVGASNVFDKEPNFAVVGSSLGTDPTQSDLRQRFIYMRLSTSF